MKYHFLIIALIALLFSACAVKPLEPVSFEEVKKELSFSQDIKPILDNRCVTCHSCYNSPCQLKLSSIDGLKRGASKKDMYANRLSADDPTRLFIDAVNEKQWRNKGFFSVTDGINKRNESIMMQYLSIKMKNPLSIENYSPENDDLSCVKDEDELASYLDKNPHKGMPYGFPALNKNEYNLLMTWLKQGAKNDNKDFNTPIKEKELIKIFEQFFNNKNIKHKVSARYIYEHLFLAHISFDDKSENFYELIRSKTPSGKKAEVIATRFPYDKIEGEFFYRFRKIESTIVHKTHMVYKLNKQKLERYNELFIKPTWDQKPFLATYEEGLVANALKVFEQIPAKNRYEFLLDDVHFIIMNFIRGPVCRGQIALNVIQDHFWVMFLDPKYDLSVKDRYFLHDNLKNLEIPNQYGDNPNILRTLVSLKNYSASTDYHRNKIQLYKKYYKEGLPLNSIWKGNSKKIKDNDSILTIYRHFDSASVHKGALGNLPKTLWVIDYPLLERIYYSLVAGFDVFGNTPHQYLVRKHMDRLRIEGEMNFLSYLPKNSRKKYFDSWYQGWYVSHLNMYEKSDLNTYMKFKTKEYKKEFVQNTFKYLEIKKDSINYIDENFKETPIRKNYENKKQIEVALKNLSIKGESEITKHFNYSQSNLAYLRIKMKDKKDLVYTIVVNKWHDNVALMFNESSRLDPSKDSLNFIEGFVGSYPNIFFEVKQEELSTFFTLIKNYKHTIKDKQTIVKYLVSRANPKFWESYDWFDKRFKEQDRLNYGIFDLNRYLKEAIKQ